jgi:hypothetical protein
LNSSRWANCPAVGGLLLLTWRPKANWYYSDAFDVYESLWYHWGRYAVSEGKTDTYSVEGNNAELRHYLARLARSSRCFPVARMLWLAQFVYLSFTSTNVNCESTSSQNTLSTSQTSFTHLFSHSPKDRLLIVPSNVVSHKKAK